MPGDIHTLFHDPAALEHTEWSEATVHTSFLQRLPQAKKHHRLFFPLYPLAIEQFDLREYKLIISSSYAVAKGVLNSSDQLHLCYCHTPMRYVWDLTFQYMEAAGYDKGLRSFIVRLIFHYIRMWDQLSAGRVNKFVANSHYIAHRIWKCYNREATVIYPPVDVDQFKIAAQRDNYFVTISRLVPYKRIDCIIRAFNKLKLPLVIVGEGPSKKQLQKIADKNISFTGQVSHTERTRILEHARAFVFSAEEDFGIVNVEAQACGVPVIAFGRGGALETVEEKKTGLFFHRQHPDAIIETVERFMATEDSFDPHAIRKNAQRFPRSRFEKEFSEFVRQAWDEFPYK